MDEPSGTTDALQRLEARLERASQAAEALMAQATGAVARGAADLAETATRAARQATGEPDSVAGAPSTAVPSSAPPSAGWQIPRSASDDPSRSELDLLIQAVTALRDLVPPELQRRLAEAVRELLLALRALIDWYLERVERRPPSSSEVQDIPIL